MQGTITTSAQFAGSIAGWNSGRIRGCYADVTINSSKEGDATDGGLVGIAYRGTVIENCLAKVAILGEKTQNCGGVVGWANDKINIANCLIVSDGSTLDVSNNASANVARNGGNLNVVNLSTYNENPYGNRPAGANYNNYVTQQWGNNNATTVVPFDELADGKVCYQLNNDQSKINWVQKLGEGGDPFPVPIAFGSTENQVYASAATGCNGKADGLTYSNTPSNVVNTPHTFDKYGICTNCGCFNFDGFEYDMTDASVLLKTTNDIYLAEGWNRIGDGFKLNMKMTDDIEVIAPEGQFIFNTSNWVDGNFNGQGHTLTIEMTNVGEHAAFIPEMTGNFENVIMHGSITTSGSRAGSISANGRMALIRNVFSDINITSSLVGDNTSGGFCGWMGDKEKRVENCIYAGTFTLPGKDGNARCARVGGFSGWAATKTYFTNCAVLGNFIGAGNQTLDNDTENSGNLSRNYGNVVSENCYVLNPIVGNAVGDADKYIHYTNTEGVANGELAFLLNSNQSGLDRFYQLIGTDPEPMPVAKEGALVYSVAAEYRCDGTPLGEASYTNTATTPDIPAHTNVDGWCTVCGSIQEDYIVPVDGWYEISNGEQLAWWSNYASKHPTVKARLTADINMDGKMTSFMPVGTQANLFVGEFDGQGHIIKNFVLTSTSDYQGLFGVIGGGAVIKNFVLDSSCSISGGAFCGIVGGTNGGGSVYLSNLGNEGNVTGTAQNVSGILGVDMGGSATLFITNCYVTGAVKGARESAVICSWSNSSSVVENCWSTASLEGKYGNEDSFTRGSAACVNCYEIEGVGTQNNKTGANRTNLVTAEEVANGALCFKAGEAFGQKLGVDAHPNFTGDKVYCIAGDYYTNVCGNIEAAQGDADIILPAKKYGGEYSAYTNVAQADYDFGDWNTSNPNYNVIIGTPAEQEGKAWFAPGYDVTAWNYGQDLPEFGNGKPADVYAVRYFTVEGNIPSTLYMPAPHDDAPCEYYINGVKIWGETDGWYEDEVVRMTDEQKALIKADGKTVNVFAFHVHQNWGGRYADGGLYTAGAPVDAFNNDTKAALEATIALAQAEGIDAEVVEFAKAKSNYRGGMSTGLAQLRKARRLAADGRTETFAGTAPADGMIAYIYNVGAKMFLAGGNDWGTHASLNHMGAKCVLHANSSGDNRYTIQTNLPNGVRGKNDGLGHNGYVDCGDWNTTGANWAWEFEATGDGTYRIINCENSGNNIYLGMTDDERLQVDTDKSGADNVYNKWLLVTPEEFEALAEQATESNPVDLGHLIHQATFSQNDFDGNDKGAANDDLNDSKWERNAGGIWNWKGNDAGGDYMFEAWNTAATGKVYLKQVVEGLPAGKYTVSMSGYYRDGNFESADEGNVRKLAYLYAGTEDNCVALQNIVEGSGNYPGIGRGGASGIVIPDGCRDAAKFFQVGTYTNTIDAVVGIDGKLEIGVYRDAEDVKGADWITADNWRLYYKGNPVEVTVTDAGYATFVAPGNITTIPSEVEAFAVQKVDGKSYVHLEPVTAIPAGEAVVLKAAEGTYTINATAFSAELGTTNDLVAATEEVTADGTQYILAKQEDEVGFHKAIADTKIAAGKGYLVFTGGAGVKAFYPFEGDDATGISGLNINGSDDVIYNVAGQRIGKMQQGVNIVNGKKILK